MGADAPYLRPARRNQMELPECAVLQQSVIVITLQLYLITIFYQP
jgi:hypothetical protein